VDELLEPGHTIFEHALSPTKHCSCHDLSRKLHYDLQNCHHSPKNRLHKQVASWDTKEMAR
jgi:hypothetical protein